MVFKLNPSWSGCRKANNFSWWWMLAHLQLCQWNSLCKRDTRLERRPLEKIFIYLLIWLGISCGMWDLIPQAGIQPRLPALGALSLYPLDHQGCPWRGLLSQTGWIQILALSLALCDSRTLDRSLLFQHLSFLIFTMRMTVFSSEGDCED